MENNPNANVEEQGIDKGEDLLSSDAAKVDREKMQAGKIDDDKSHKTIYIGNPMKKRAGRRTGGVREACRSRTVALNGIMEALTCGDNNIIGVLGPESTENADLLEKVSRRAKRDGLFDVVVMATVSHKPNNTRIQDEIAEALGLKFGDEKDVAKRAKRLRERILMEQKILVILHDLCKGLDLDKVGIPYGADHTGCKLLLTSASEEVLSKEMHAQKIFKV